MQNKYKKAPRMKSFEMATMDPLQYIKTLKPMIGNSLATRGAMRTEAVATTEPPKGEKKESTVMQAL